MRLFCRKTEVQFMFILMSSSWEKYFLFFTFFHLRIPSSIYVSRCTLIYSWYSTEQLLIFKRGKYMYKNNHLCKGQTTRDQRSSSKIPSDQQLDVLTMFEMGSKVDEYLPCLASWSLSGGRREGAPRAHTQGKQCAPLHQVWQEFRRAQHLQHNIPHLKSTEPLTPDPFCHLKTNCLTVPPRLKWAL